MKDTQKKQKNVYFESFVRKILYLCTLKRAYR